MNVSLTGRQIELTDPIKDYINSSIETLEKFNLNIISVYAVVSNQENKHKSGITIEFTINLPGKHTVVIKQRDADLYAAIDLAADRAQKALRRMHDRMTDIDHDTINEAKTDDADIKEESLAQEDEIIPVELELYKPREVADVLEDLKQSNKQFEIFIDNDGKTRVMYKRNDGRFGLY